MDKTQAAPASTREMLCSSRMSTPRMLANKPHPSRPNVLHRPVCVCVCVCVCVSVCVCVCACVRVNYC